MITTNDFDNLMSLLYFFLIFRFFSYFLDIVTYIVGDVVFSEGIIKAKEVIFQKIQDLDFSFHVNKSTGSLISAFKRGDGAFWSFYDSIHFRIVRAVMGYIVMFYFFADLDIRVALISFVSLLINFIISFFLIRTNVSARRAQNDSDDLVSGVIVDNMVNFETVKYFAKEKRERMRLSEKLDIWRKTFWRYSWTFKYFNFTLGPLFILTIFAILWYSLNMVISGKMTTGDFVLVVTFVSTFYHRIFDLVWSLRNIAKDFADMSKYFSYLNMNDKVRDAKNPVILEVPKGEIEFKNISFGYKGGKKNAIKDLSLNIREGQSVALVGRSGSGKTTLSKLLMRFYDVDSGEITIDGVNIKNFTKSYLRSLMGVVPQEPILFNSTIKFNIGYAKDDVTDGEIVAAAKMANIHRFIESLPKKYDTEVGERGIKLSGGQKQRLAIARMILSDPKIIIFDEATSQLDSENEKLIQDAFWEFARNKTTIIIAHRLSTAMRADRIIVMQGGKIQEEGNHAKLTKKKGSLYKYFWELQTGIEKPRA